MTALQIGVSSMDELERRIAAAFDGQPQQPRISFASYELLHRVLTPRRMDLLRAMIGAGPIGVRELARKVARDVSNVHADIDALVKAGVIDRTDAGIEFPYDALHLAYEMA